MGTKRRGVEVITVRWSPGKEAYVATCPNYPMESHEADHPVEAVRGLWPKINLAAHQIDDDTTTFVANKRGGSDG